MSSLYRGLKFKNYQEAELWKQVYVAAASSNRDVYAYREADRALSKYRERMSDLANGLTVAGGPYR